MLTAVKGTSGSPATLLLVMHAPKIDEHEWVVVCDGAKALILENVGDRKFPNLRARETRTQDDRPTREIGSDAPGRAFQSVGTMRSAVEQTDWHQQNEDRFLSALAHDLDRAAAEGKVKSLLLVAPPRALGVLRRHYTPRLRDVLRAEIDRDYVKLPVHEIEQRLGGS
jgi:protein required for attachment to host cells